MSDFLRSLAADLRERQLLPAVVLLLLLAVGIPIFASAALSSSAAPGPPAVSPVNTAPPAGTPLPTQETAVVSTAPAQSSTTYKGSEPNPFRAAAAAPAATPSGSTPAVTTTTPSTTTTTTTPATTTTTTTKPTGSTPTKRPATSTAAPASLASDEAYTIDGQAIYGSETDKLENVERLTPLPANVGAEIVYLGVVKGGKSAAFLLTGSISVKLAAPGSATCIPSASNCEVIELRAGEQLQLTPTTANSGVSNFTFKLSSIQAQKFASRASATAARQGTSAAGEQLIAQSTSAGLASFFYDINIGALVYEPPAAGSTGSTGTSGSTGSTGATGQSNGVVAVGDAVARAFKSARR